MRRGKISRNPVKVEPDPSAMARTSVGSGAPFDLQSNTFRRRSTRNSDKILRYQLWYINGITSRPRCQCASRPGLARKWSANFSGDATPPQDFHAAGGLLLSNGNLARDAARQAKIFVSLPLTKRYAPFFLHCPRPLGLYAAALPGLPQNHTSALFRNFGLRAN